MAASYAVEQFGLSVRRACGLVGLWRSTQQYQPQRKDDKGFRARLRELAEQRRRYGAPRLHVILKREGLVINHKRTERVYREEGLSLRLRKRKKRASGLRIEMPKPERVNQRWSMDFVSDALWTGRRFRILTIVDNYSRECPWLEVDTSIGGERVCRVLDQIAATRGTPEMITVDNGPEFSGRALDEWAYQRGVKLNFIRPGKPTENAYIESFNGKFREECLNEHWFTSFNEARERIESWRQDYNMFRPHSSIGDLTPNEFAAKNSVASTASIGGFST